MLYSSPFHAKPNQPKRKLLATDSNMEVEGKKLRFNKVFDINAAETRVKSYYILTLKRVLQMVMRVEYTI